MTDKLNDLIRYCHERSHEQGVDMTMAECDLLVTMILEYMAKEKVTAEEMVEEE